MRLMSENASLLAVALYSELNILSFVIMAVIAVKALTIMNGSAQRIRLFAASVFLAMGANVCDFLWNLGFNKYWAIPAGVMWTIDFTYFMSFGMSSYCWFMYTETVYREKSFKKRTYFLLALPLVLLAGILILSCFNGCVFYFDDSGVYHRGALFYAQHVLSYGYILFSSVRCLIRAVERRFFDRKEQFIAMASFAVPPIICGIIQIYFQNIPVLSVGIVVSFIIVFINSVESLISTDALTGIANRRELLHRLSAEIKSLKPDTRLYFLFIDMDSFKAINDTYGHSEGDRALKATAEIIEEISAEADGFCARYGGDEFAMTVKLGNKSDISEIYSRIYGLISRKSKEEKFGFDLNVSIGCAEYKSDMSGIQELIACADSDMYNKKMNKKAARA